jgi:hypothetical protein
MGRHRRALTHLESFVALDEIGAAFDNARDHVLSATEEARLKLAATLGREIIVARRADTLRDYAARPVAPPPALVEAFSATGLRYFEQGRRQVAGELERQARGRPVTADPTAEPPVRVQAAERERRVRLADELDKVDVWAALKELARAGALTVASAMREAALRVAARPSAPPAEAALEAAVADAAEAAGETEAMRASALLHDVVNLGRAAKAQDNAERISNCVYSAILDGATCDACEAMDGQETTSLDEAQAWTPHPSCQGGARCRCIVVYELES